jgi:fatty acid desaturase
MRRVGRHAGQRAAEPSPAPRPPRRRILLLAFFVTVTLVAWGVLVFAAIDFGSEARSGDSTAWKFLVLAAVGAAACLFVTMILGGRLLAAVRGRQATPPRAARVPGRRVAR